MGVGKNQQKNRAKRAQAKASKRAAKKKNSRKTSTTSKGLNFEIRAARAISQVKPDLYVKHNAKLFTQPGHRRQFDVVGHLNGVVAATYEARDHDRKVEIGQLEAFETKNATLRDKPRVAGIISSNGFWERPIGWVRFFLDPNNEPKLVQELYQLRASVPEDWTGDPRQIRSEATGNSLKTLPVRIIYGDTLPAGSGRDVTLTSGRRDTFLFDSNGRVIGNLLDYVNKEMRRAIETGDIGRRTVRLPTGSRLTSNSCTRTVIGLEIEFEAISVPAVTVIDRTARYPDTLIDALTGHQWLIEDRTRALKASRNGFDLTLAYAEPEDPSFLDLDQLPAGAQIEEPGMPTGIATTVAALSLHAALANLRSARSDVVPETVADLLRRAWAAFANGDFTAAEALYKETLTQGTALEALCNLAYLASERGDHAAAAYYSLAATKTFPFEPQGFANLIASLIALRELATARTVLERIQLFHGVAFAVRRQEADVLFLEGRFAEAADIYFELSLDDDDPVLVANLARCEHALGHHAGAAWDATTAWKQRPDDLLLASLAAAYAEEANDLQRVLSIVRNVADRQQGLPIQLARHACNAEIRLGNAAAARAWLDHVPRSQWHAIDFAMYGQLRAISGGLAAAKADLDTALATADIDDATRLGIADFWLRTGNAADALSALNDCRDPAARRLRAFAHAILGDADSAIAAVASMPDEDANRTIKECMVYCPNKIGGDLSALTRFSNWLMARTSTDTAVMARQAWLLAAQACGRRDTVLAERALALCDRLRREPGEAANAVLPEVLALLAAGREDEAQALLTTLNGQDQSADLLAVAAYTAIEGQHWRAAADLADAAAVCSKPLRNFPAEQLRTMRVLTAVACGRDAEQVLRVAGGGALSSDESGVFARALVAYVEQRTDECVAILTPLVSSKRKMVQAFMLRAQCLAEQGAYEQLLHDRAYFQPEIIPFLEWAADRSAGEYEPGLLPAVAVTFAMQLTPEFAAITQRRNLHQTAAAANWLAAVRQAYELARDCDAVWVARLRHPATYLQSLMRLAR
jgi:hypothetical protein